MFTPKTERLKFISENSPERIVELESLFVNRTNIYIDYANVRPWSTKLGWHIDLKRLKQFLDSFSNIQSIKIYNGTLIGDEESTKLNEEIVGYGYDVKTKPVKIMKQSIDVSSIPTTSPDLLKKFVRKCLLRKYDLDTIEYLNSKFGEMNKNGIHFIEDLKCNFDVEIGRDMLLDYERNHVDTFVLWSGDSDFADPVEQLLKDGKKVMLCSTARKVSTELSNLREKGLVIFDIQKIRNFICWKKEIQGVALPLEKQKGLPFGAPKL